MRIRFIGQVCLLIQGICFSDRNKFLVSLSGILLSRETMEYLRPNQSFVGLQCLLWLNNPIRERQSLLQLLQVKPVTASVGTDSALCRLRCPLFLPLAFLFPSLSFTAGPYGEPAS